MLIKQLDILTPQPGETYRFYSDILGLEMVSEDDHSMNFKAGESILKFSFSSFGNPYYHFAFNIPNNQIQQAVEWISKRTDIIPVEGQSIADFRNWNAEALYFMDPTGNILEFIARKDLNNHSGSPFSPYSILNISEAAVVTHDVRTLVSKMEKAYDILPFSKQPVKDDFAALGDDNGLLILSGNDRHWYPTHIPALPFPVQVSLMKDNELLTLDFNMHI